MFFNQRSKRNTRQKPITMNKFLLDKLNQMDLYYVSSIDTNEGFFVQLFDCPAPFERLIPIYCLANVFGYTLEINKTNKITINFIKNEKV